MKKKIFTTALISAIIGSLIIPYSYLSISADQYEEEEIFSETGSEDPDVDKFFSSEDDPESIDPDPDPIPDPDPVEDIEIGPDDIDIFPSNKKISVGSSFKIDITQADPDFWEEYDEDVWEDSYDKYIGSIEFKSKKSYVAKVNANGVVKGRHKGTTVIIITIYFNTGEKLVRKTKVKVKK